MELFAAPVFPTSAVGLPAGLDSAAAPPARPDGALVNALAAVLTVPTVPPTRPVVAAAGLAAGVPVKPLAVVLTVPTVPPTRPVVAATGLPAGLAGAAAGLLVDPPAGAVPLPPLPNNP